MALLDLQYGYDAVGNINHIGSPTANEDLGHTYDGQDRLTGVSGSYTETYAYNAVGNLTSRQANGAPPITYTYGLTQPHAVRALTNGGQFTYDCNGNMLTRVEVSGTQRITYTQQWDAENRLTVVTNTSTTPNRVSKFIYDGDGQRVMQVQISGTQVITTAYAGALEVQIAST